MNQIESLPVSDLIPYARNSRTHSDEQVTQIAASIREFGFTNPVLIDSNGTIIAGHGRVMAAKKVGLAEVPCLRLQHLSPSQIRAYVIADNKLALNAGWDDEMLKAELLTLQEEGFNTDLTGFSDDELNALLNSEIIEGQTDPDEIPEPPVEPVTKLGDIWVLGNHRLMCGDSSNPLNVERLMDGKNPELVFTDPPYNIGYKDMASKFDKIENDKMSESDFIDFLRSTIVPCEVMYVCCSWQYSHLFKQVLLEIEKPAKAMIVWDKINRAQNLDLYYKQHEIIFYHGPFGGQSTVRGDVWQLKRQRNTTHPTMKPVELIEMALEDHPNRKLVFDGFGGSGSTLIACEKVRKNARLMELEPKYCDVTIKRWEDFTGKKAVLEKV
jgi:DNA modification methylase